MAIVTFMWLVGPLVVLCLVLGWAVRRSTMRREALERARFRGRTSEAGLASAMSEAMTRMRGQEMAQRARYEALDGFLRQVVESLPHGVFVLGTDGNLRLANAEALRWLGLRTVNTAARTPRISQEAYNRFGKQTDCEVAYG